MIIIVFISSLKKTFKIQALGEKLEKIINKAEKTVRYRQKEIRLKTTALYIMKISPKSKPKTIINQFSSSC